ncbi:MAG: TIGR02391 family protein [Patescibacteria group bacterium]
MKKYIKKKKSPPRHRYSPREQQVIRDLADILGKLLPATSQGKFSLQTIAKERGLSKFFVTELSKKKQFTRFIADVHKAHPRTLKTFINDILADAVSRRRTQGNPVLRPEADLLKNKLLEFGIDLSIEIDELELPVTRPNITPPPQVIQQVLERIGLHPSLLPHVLSLFKEGHINEAVRKSGEILEAFVTRSSGERGRYGRDLMATVFNKDNPIIDISMYHESEISNPMDEKEGFMFVAMGTMQWCKNIVGHGDVKQLPPHEGASRIILVSHLLEVIDSVLAKRSGEPSKI